MRTDALIERILYEDAHVLVIDKPAGLAVHAGPRGERSLDDLLDTLRLGFQRRPGLAHRLDRDTSGCLALGRNERALKRLNALFAAGQIEKVYWAVTANAPRAERGQVTLPLRKVVRTQGWRMVAGAGGQEAVTDWQVLGRAADGRAWLELRPRTGRTHQVRVHAAALGAPVEGDHWYGAAAPGAALHLHARALTIPYRPAGPPIQAVAPPPAHMQAALAACGWVPTRP